MIPSGWSAQQAHGWAGRQRQMQEWYSELIADPETAVQCFNSDYRPFAPILAQLSGSVLDVGGGNGIARHFLPECTEYVVIDPSLGWLDPEWSTLSGAFPCLGTQPTFVRGVGEYLPFRSSSFDHALSFWSLNHASRPEAVLREVFRVLRTAGRFLVVLEDMEPGWRDLFTLAPLRVGWESRRGLVASKLWSTLGRRDWPLQADHLRVLERELREWIAGRFVVAGRGWIGQYLTYDLRRL